MLSSHWVAKSTVGSWDKISFMSFLCTFTLYLLGYSLPCFSLIFWPLEHIFSYLLYLLSTWFGHVTLLLDTFKWRLCMTRSRSLSCLFMRNSSCLISPRDTARALVLPLLFSRAFHTFSNIAVVVVVAVAREWPVAVSLELAVVLVVEVAVAGGVPFGRLVPPKCPPSNWLFYPKKK